MYKNKRRINENKNFNMTARPLIIDDNIREQFAELVRFAEKNPYTTDNILDIINEEMIPAGETEGYYINMPFGYRVVYCIEQQPVGDVRHLSIIVNERGALPSTIAVKEIMKLIGFENELEECHVALEEVDTNWNAVNVLEIIKK